MASEKKKYDLSRFKVLIAEDFEFIKDLLSASLREMGVGEVITAENGLQAKDLILNYNAVSSSSNIDVVILDWLMPEMSGEEVLAWMRNHRAESIRFLPVVACTAYASEDIVRLARDQGCNEVTVKPISAEKIARRIQYVIDKPRPFIKCTNFFGPDRRRKDEPYAGTDKRRTKAEEITQHVEQLS